MKEFVTGEALANWLGMLRVVDQRTFILVEGPSDAQALDPQIDETSAATVPAYSKPKAVKALEAVESRGIERVVAIVDLDWDGLLLPMQESSNVIYTDDYDLDATILLTGDVLERVLSNFSERNRRKQFCQEHGVSTEEVAVDIASAVGSMRYVSESHSHGIRCRDFPVHVAMTEDHREVHVEMLAVVAVKRSPSATVTEGALALAVREAYEQLEDKRRMSSGHDMAAALSALIHHWGGNASREAIERAARAAFGCAELKQTKLFIRMTEWAGRNDTRVWSCV